MNSCPEQQPRTGGLEPGPQETLGSSIKGRRRASVIQFLFSYAGIALTIVKGLVFVPLYLRFFDLATYGAWLATGNLVAMLGVVEGGFGMVFAQRIAGASGARAFGRIPALVGSGGVLIIAFAALIGASAVLAPWTGGWVGAPVPQRPALGTAFAFAAIGAALYLIMTNTLAIPYAFQRSTVPGLIMVGAQFVEIVVIAAGLYGGLGVVSLGMGMAAGAVVGLAAAVAYAWRVWRAFALRPPRFERAEAVSALKATGPMWIGRAASAINGNSESAIIAVLLGPTAAGLLAITDRAFRTAQSLVNPVANAMFYGLAHLAGEASRERVRAVVGEIMTVSAAIASVALPLAFALNRGFVALWVGADKVAGPGLNALVFASSLVVVRMNLIGQFLPALGEMRRNAWSAVVELGARLLMMWTLLPILGIWGAPVAMIIATAITNLWFLTWVLGIHLELKPPQAFALHLHGAGALVVGVGVGVGASLLSLPTSWPAFVVRAFVTAGVIVCAVVSASPWLRREATKALGRMRAVLQ